MVAAGRSGGGSPGRRGRRPGGRSFTCGRCGQVHEGPPLAYGADYPDAWAAIPEPERPRRVALSEEQCIIDQRDFYVRARLAIPVLDGPGPFEWGVWVSVGPKSFLRMAELWTSPGREREPPYTGWLQTDLPGYPPTLGLRCRVLTQPVGERPLVELETSKHPLALEQRRGMTSARVQEIAEQLLHP
jgi:hypothetical protein